MDCRLFALQAEDWLDGRLDAAQRMPMQLHVDGCPRCLCAYRRAEELRARLRMLQAPELRPGFAEQALARAAAAPAGVARFAHRGVLGMALAASVLLGLGVGLVLFALRSGPEQTVVLRLRQAESVRLVFNSTKPLQGATLRVKLPENVEIVGYGARRELTWRTDLRAGANQLQLPLIARAPADGDLVARLSLGARSRTFRLTIKVKGADAAGALPVVLASMQPREGAMR